jgi:hypothetical protein
MRVFKRLLIVAVAAGFATATVTTSAGAGSTLSKKQYLKTGNKICKAGDMELEALFGNLVAVDGSDELTPEQTEEIFARFPQILRNVFDDVEALEGPAPLDKKVDALLDKYRAVVDDVETDPESVSGEDAADPFAKLHKKMRRLGLTACARLTGPR